MSEMPEKRYCRECGKEVNSIDQFCPACGAEQHPSVEDERTAPTWPLTTLGGLIMMWVIGGILFFIVNETAGEVVSVLAVLFTFPVQWIDLRNAVRVGKLGTGAALAIAIVTALLGGILIPIYLAYRHTQQ
jgi:hypothetical protein